MNRIKKIIEKGYVETLVCLYTSCFEENDTKKLFGLLLNAGYLTIAVSDDIDYSIYTVKIPNHDAYKALLLLKLM